GKVVIMGNTDFFDREGFALVRRLADGSPDPSFGSGGIVETDLGASTYIAAIDIEQQPDGKLLVAGEREACCGNFGLLFRYDTGGTLDAGFGSGGIVTVAPGTSSS